MGGEDAILEGLRGHPAHGEQAFPAFPVIVSLIDVSRHAKICEGRGHESYTEQLSGISKGALSLLVRRVLYPHPRVTTRTGAGHQCAIAQG